MFELVNIKPQVNTFKLKSFEKNLKYTFIVENLKNILKRKKSNLKGPETVVHSINILGYVH